MIQTQASNPFVDLLHRVAEAARAIWRRNISANEVARLGTQETTCLARDLGISTSDLRVLAGQDKNAADLLVRRMMILGLDPAKLDLAVMRDLQRCCSMCRDKQLCIHELEDKPREVSSWPKYCPNENTLAALTAEQTTIDQPSQMGGQQDTGSITFLTGKPLRSGGRRRASSPGWLDHFSDGEVVDDEDGGPGGPYPVLSVRAPPT